MGICKKHCNQINIASLIIVIVFSRVVCVFLRRTEAFSWDKKVEYLILDTNLPDSVADYNTTKKSGTTSKEQKAVVKANHQAIAYLTLALKPIELLPLITRAVSDEWPEEEAWRVMQQL